MDEQSTVFDMFGEHSENAFGVRVTDANGADAAVIYSACLSAIGVSNDEHERFISSGIITLSKKQIYAVKGSPELALIIAPHLSPSTRNTRKRSGAIRWTCGWF